MLPDAGMYLVFHIDYLLFGKEGIFGRIAHRKQAGEFVAFGNIHDFLDLFRLGMVRVGEHAARRHRRRPGNGISCPRE